MGICHITNSQKDSRACSSNSVRPLPLQSDSNVPSLASIVPFCTLSTLESLYIIGHELGRGQCGVIRSCRLRASGALFACKSISKRCINGEYDVTNVVREVRITRHVAGQKCPSSRTIVRLYDVIEDKNFVYLILELCRGGDLYEKLVKQKSYSEVDAAPLMKSLLEAVQFCHSRGIIHRDIKPENILLAEASDTSSIKLVDFGLALEFSAGQRFSGIAGSAYYMAPEVLEGEYSEQIDTWSAGVIMYLLLSGTPPFTGATQQRIYKAIQKSDLSFPPNLWGGISSAAKDLISKMLNPNAKLRITPAQALEHPWILGHMISIKGNRLNHLSLAKCKNFCVLESNQLITVLPV